MSVYLVTLNAFRFPADLTGLKIAPYRSATFADIESLGAVVAPVAETELYQALQTGVIDLVAAGDTRDLRLLSRMFGEDIEFRSYDIPPPSGEPTTGPDDLGGTAGPDTVRLLAGDDTYSGLGGDDRVHGGAGKDEIRGGAGDDRLWGGGARDKLFGDGGNDTLRGDGGNDVLFGGAGRDVLLGAAGRDKLVGGGANDNLSGQAGNDTLLGGAGKDVLNGGKGRDELDGGQGNDVMTGGAGADVFVFATYGEKNRDTITDFKKGVDTLVLLDGDYRMVKVDGNVVLRFGGGESLTLEGVASRNRLEDSIEVSVDPGLPTRARPLDAGFQDEFLG